MERSWLILADDLTGAADTSVGFAAAGLETIVGWGDCADGAGDSPRVFSFNMDSRTCAAKEAAAAQMQACRRFLRADRVLLKKIDSTLRGQPAAEVAAAFEVVREVFGAAFGVLAPAFPKNARTTVGGRVRVGGIPLETYELWRRDHTYPNADLCAILGSVGLTAGKVSLETVRAGSDRIGGRFRELALSGAHVAVCDAETEQDLASIASAGLAGGPGTFFVGAGGISHAIASHMGPARAPGLSLPASRKGALVVVGSFAKASRNAARCLSSTGRVFHVPISPDVLLGDNSRPDQSTLAMRIVDALEAGDDVLAEILLGSTPDLTAGRRLTQALAQVLRPSALHMSGLAVTGGETAGEVLSQFGYSGLRLHHEVLPGICLGTSLGGAPIPVVTKAGSFGDEMCLIRILDCLRSIRGRG